MLDNLKQSPNKTKFAQKQTINMNLNDLSKISLNRKAADVASMQTTQLDKLGKSGSIKNLDDQYFSQRRSIS